MNIGTTVTGQAALEELAWYGWFERRGDGWYQYVKCPRDADMERFVFLVQRLGAYSVGIDGKFPPIQVTRRGDSVDGLVFKVNR